jgi:hypothetical protein
MVIGAASVATTLLRVTVGRTALLETLTHGVVYSASIAGTK